MPLGNPIHKSLSHARRGCLWATTAAALLAGCQVDGASRNQQSANTGQGAGQASPKELSPTKSGYANVNGTRIYYQVHGDLASGRTPVLLLHGGMNTIDLNFAELIPQLAEHRPVVAVEQQGHGHTADRNAPVTLATMRRDTLAVLDQLGIEKVHAVGFSMGGMLGLELAVNAPDRIASLSAISASANVRGMIPQILQMNQDPNFKPSPEVAEILPTQADFKEMQGAFAGNPSGPKNFPIMMKKLGSLITGNWGWSDDELTGIGAPVLLAIGDRDFILPAHALAMAETIPEARLAILPDTTHMNIMKRPELLLPMIEGVIAAAQKNQGQEKLAAAAAAKRRALLEEKDV